MLGGVAPYAVGMVEHVCGDGLLVVTVIMVGPYFQVQRASSVLLDGFVGFALVQIRDSDGDGPTDGVDNVFESSGPYPGEDRAVIESFANLPQVFDTVARVRARRVGKDGINARGALTIHTLKNAGSVEGFRQLRLILPIGRQILEMSFSMHLHVMSNFAGSSLRSVVV